ncbi:MAG: AI-2E family transporter [Anaerolineae bacterium]
MNEPDYHPAGEGDLARDLATVWLSYLRGQLLLALIMGLITGVVSAAIGLRYPLAIGLAAGILETVPTIGPIIAAAIAAIVALVWGSGVIPVDSWVLALIVLAIFLVLQQLESWILVPVVAGKQLHMHPLLILASVIVGGLIGGILIPVVGAILGAYLAVPVVASARVLYRHMQTNQRPPAQ